LELTSRVITRSTAEPHSISRLARNEYRGAQRLSDRRDDWSPLPIDLASPPAKDPKARRPGVLAARSSQAYAFREHTHSTPEMDVLFPAMYLILPYIPQQRTRSAKSALQPYK